MKGLKILALLLLFFSQTLVAQSVWPGDVNNNGIANEADLLQLGSVFGKTGPRREVSSADWAAQPIVELWADTFPNGVNLVYADCNGDGIIDKSDAEIISIHYNLRHSDVPFIPDVILPGIPGLSPAFQFTGEDKSITSNRPKKLEIALGSELIPIDSIRGVSFLIKMDPTTFNVKETSFQFNGNTWLKGNGTETITKTVTAGRSTPGDYIVAITSTNALTFSGSGPIGTITLSPSFVIEGNAVDLRIIIDSIIMLDQNLNQVPVLGTNLLFEIPDSLLPYDELKTAAICPSDSYDFHGEMLNSGGIYKDTLPNSMGQDSVVWLNLGIKDTAQTMLTEEICNGDSFFFNNQNLMTAGTYRDTLVAANGCDSFIVLDLSIMGTTQTTIAEEICNGSSYFFNNQNISATGIYEDTLTAVNGCDSMITLNLNVLNTIQTSLNEEICNGSSYFFNNQNISTTGIYEDTLTAVNGCDSFITLNLTILNTIQTSLNEEVCNGSSYFFNNQNISATGIYEDTLTAVNGCDSMITLNLTILNTIQTNLNEEICNGSSYFFKNQNLNTTGIYLDTLTASNGCDSFITLNLNEVNVIQSSFLQTICNGDSYNFANQSFSTTGVYSDTLTATNGCDSISVLILNVISTFQTVIAEEICGGSSYFFNNQNLNIAGTYRDTLSAANGCDSVVTLNLSTVNTLQTAITETICNGNSYFFNNQHLNATGTYQDTLVGTNGCDSMVTLTLNVINGVQTTLQETICDGDSYFFNNQNLTVSGAYQDTLLMGNGCDSILVLMLTIASIPETTMAVTVCQGDSYFFNDQSLFNAGTYIDTLMTSNGCDSIVALNLAVASFAQTTLSQTICGGETYLFNNQQLGTSGSYSDTLTTTSGCDSIILLNLTISTTSDTMIAKAICQGESISYNGFNLNTAGTYLFNLSNQEGCDSIVRLNLTILETYESIVDTTMCEGDTISLLGFVLTTATTYWVTLPAANGCDSTVTIRLRIGEDVVTLIDSTVCSGDTMLFNGFQPLQSGVYMDTLVNASGCDSLIQLNLTIENCPITTNTEETLLKKIAIYPNPMDNWLTIKAANVKIHRIDFVYLTGQILQTTDLRNSHEEEHQLDVSGLPSGVYWVLIHTDLGIRQEKILRM